MYMDEVEICNRYRDAKYPRDMIRILSEINLCTEKRIERILRKHGYAVQSVGNFRAGGAGAPKPKNKSWVERENYWRNQMPAIRQAIWSGKSVKEIAKQYQVTASTIYKWIRLLGGIYGQEHLSNE